MSSNTILSVEHLTKLFKSGEQTLTVLRDVSFEVEAGSTCAIVGPSGSGKTTLIAICAGLERPSEGTVIFNGVPLHRSREEELAQIRNQFIKISLSKVIHRSAGLPRLAHRALDLGPRQVGTGSDRALSSRPTRARRGGDPRSLYRPEGCPHARGHPGADHGEG